MGSLGRLYLKQATSYPSLIHTPKQSRGEIFPRALIRGLLISLGMLESSPCVYLPCMLWDHWVWKQNTNSKEQIAFYLYNKAAGMQGRGKGSSSACWGPPCEHQVEPQLHQHPAAPGKVLVGGREGGKQGCGLHPTSFSFTNDGCMLQNLGANSTPEQMQTARSWKCVSATAGGSAVRQGWFQQPHRGSLRTSSVQTALTHQLSQMCPAAGGKGEPAQPHNDDVCSPTATAVQGHEPGEMETLLTACPAFHPISCTDRTNRRSPA